MKQKVLGYIVRKKGCTWELLVFEHQDFPEAGIQIPGGTVEPDDDNLSSAILREIKEEAGICELDILTKIFSEIYYHPIQKELQERHFFVLQSHVEEHTWLHTVQSSGEDNGLQFHYYWKDLCSVSHLAGDHHVAIRRVINFLENYPSNL